MEWINTEMTADVSLLVLSPALQLPTKRTHHSVQLLSRNCLLFGKEESLAMVDANVNIIDIYMCLKKAYSNENQLVGKLRQKIALCFVKSLVCVTSTVRLRGSILWFFGP